MDESAVVEAEDGDDRAGLDADCVGVCGFGGVAGEAKGFLDEDEVSSGGDWEIFGDAFDEAKDDCLPPFHEGESFVGTNVNSGCVLGLGTQHGWE